MTRKSLTGAVLGLALGVTDASAANLVQSSRPMARPDIVPAVSASTLRPQLRPARLDVPVESPDSSGLSTWIREFRARALAQGVSGAVFDRAMAGVRYDAEVIRRDRNQSEFTKAIWDYLDSAASDLRIANGKAALRKHAGTLEKIEARYGVDKEVVVAIWGLESAYGTFKGSDDVIQSLATLAFDGRRGAFFEAQLIAALQIIEAGDVDPRAMKGSWAGAMGHTQFMPTSYLEHAQDFTGDGKRDIWSDDPTDALASTAAYLKRFGWVAGQPWGVEVRLPDGFDYTLAARKIEKRPSDWAALGIKDLKGAAVPDHGAASILLPAGSAGPAFMIFRNFEVIERYNTADAYVIGVGHLSDRIAGAGAIKQAWPRNDRTLSYDERKELQRRLTAAGFNTKGVDGKIGPLTIDAVRAYQRSAGLVPDGYASLRLLNALR